MAATPSIYMNPTGANGNGGITPPTGGAGNYGFGNTANPNPATSGTNPYAVTAPTAKDTTMVPGSTTGPSGPYALDPFQIPGTQNYTGNAAAFGNELGKIYGMGEGSLLYNYLQSGAGYSGGLTEQAVNATWQAMQSQIQQGLQDIYTSEGATGISPTSSTSALQTSNFLAQSEATANAIAAQDYYNMWNASQQREAGIIADTMQGAGSYKANKPGLFSTLSSIFDTASSGADIWSTIAGLIP